MMSGSVTHLGSVCNYDIFKSCSYW